MNEGENFKANSIFRVIKTDFWILLTNPPYLKGNLILNLEGKNNLQSGLLITFFVMFFCVVFAVFKL